MLFNDDSLDAGKCLCGAVKASVIQMGSRGGWGGGWGRKARHSDVSTILNYSLL